MNAPAHFTTAVTYAVNRYLRLDPTILPRLANLSGKVIAVDITELNSVLYLLPGAAGIEVQMHCDTAPDVTLRGPSWALMRLGMQKNNAATQTMLATGNVEISGDMDLVQRFKHILDAMDIDWEELLSKLTGDVLAHKLANAARDTRDWGKGSFVTLGQNFTEYQQEEARNLPTQYEINEFLKAADVLRDDVARMEQRVRRLLNTLTSADPEHTF